MYCNIPRYSARAKLVDEHPRAVAFLAVRSIACSHFNNAARNRPDVSLATVPSLLLLCDDLGCHVRHCPDKLVDLANNRLRGIAHSDRRAKVANFRIHVLVEEHVVALEIAVDDSPLVQEADPQ